MFDKTRQNNNPAPRKITGKKPTRDGQKKGFGKQILDEILPNFWLNHYYKPLDSGSAFLSVQKW